MINFRNNSILPLSLLLSKIEFHRINFKSNTLNFNNNIYLVNINNNNKLLLKFWTYRIFPATAALGIVTNSFKSTIKSSDRRIRWDNYAITILRINIEGTCATVALTPIFYRRLNNHNIGLAIWRLKVYCTYKYIILH